MSLVYDDDVHLQSTLYLNVCVFVCACGGYIRGLAAVCRNTLVNDQNICINFNCSLLILRNRMCFLFVLYWTLIKLKPYILMLLIFFVLQLVFYFKYTKKLKGVTNRWQINFRTINTKGVFGIKSWIYAQVVQ